MAYCFFLDRKKTNELESNQPRQYVRFSSLKKEYLHADEPLLGWEEYENLLVYIIVNATAASAFIIDQPL